MKKETKERKKLLKEISCLLKRATLVQLRDLKQFIKYYI